MANKALCVGINDYPVDGADLQGCVNDANAWADLLVERFDFPRSQVRLLTDRRAKKAAILDGLKKLLAGAKKGDILAFTNSSHGSYIPDKENDEPDGYDETICPWDVRDAQITDDELRRILEDIPTGVRFTMVSRLVSFRQRHAGRARGGHSRAAVPGQATRSIPQPRSDPAHASPAGLAQHETARAHRHSVGNAARPRLGLPRRRVLVRRADRVEVPTVR